MTAEQFANALAEAGQVGTALADVRRGKALAVVLQQAKIVDAGEVVDLSVLDQPRPADFASRRRTSRTSTTTRTRGRRRADPEEQADIQATADQIVEAMQAVAAEREAEESGSEKPEQGWFTRPQRTKPLFGMVVSQVGVRVGTTPAERVSNHACDDTEEVAVNDLSPQGRGPQPGAMAYDDSVFQRLLKERIIFLGSPVEDTVANLICAQMLLLAAEDPERDIYLYINSPQVGRSRRDGDLRHDAVRPQRRRNRGDGTGRFDGAVPPEFRPARQALQPAARPDHDAPAVRRHRRYGLGHQDPGRADALHQEADGPVDLRADRPNGRADRVGLDRDRWFSAEEAKEYGFVDHVVQLASDVTGSGGTA